MAQVVVLFLVNGRGNYMKKWKYTLPTADIMAFPNTPVLVCGDIDSNLKKAAELGFDAIEIQMREDTMLDYGMIRTKMYETGTQISAISTGRLFTEGECTLIDDRTYIMNTAMQAMKVYIDTAAELNADVIIGRVRGSIPFGGNEKRLMERLARNLRILEAHALHKGVRLVIETLNRYETNLFNTTKEIVEFVEENDLSNCYVHMDTFHMNIEESNMIQAIYDAGEYLGYVHLADNTRNYPGSGCLDFKTILNALEDIGYDGYLGMEYFPIPDGEEAAKNGLEYLKGII